MEGQHFTASGERQFDGYKLYQTATPDSTTGYVSRPYTVGTKFMDADRAGIKRIKEIVGEDGSVVIRVYLLDPRQQNKRSDGTLNTDGYMLLAETKPIKPGDYNKEELVVKKTPLKTIAHTVTDPRTGAKRTIQMVRTFHLISKEMLLTLRIRQYLYHSWEIISVTFLQTHN